MTLRAKLSLVLCVLLALSIGLTGGILIYKSERGTQKSLAHEHQLFAENRAFALRDNLQILEGELERLSLLPQVDLTDQNHAPEAELLESSHRHSLLYNIAVLFVSAEGECIGAVPDRPEWKNRHFGSLPWFAALKREGRDALFRVEDDRAVGRTVEVVQPVIRKDRFVGALIGIIALDQANIIIPGLRENLPPLTDALLIDHAGRVIFPVAAPGAREGTVTAAGATEQGAVAAGAPLAEIVRKASEAPSATLTAVVDGQDSLFAFAEVHAGTDFIVVFRRPWSAIVEHLRSQVRVLAEILLVGVVVAAAAGLFLSAYLTRPLELLRASAARIATGQHGPPIEVGRVARRDELGTLVYDFLEMERAIQQRDRELREAKDSLERRVASRTAELEVAQEALVRAERFAAMGKTSAAIAHELKNALNGLGMAVELIIEDPSNPRVGRLRVQVVAEIERLRDVVDSLSSFSRLPRIEKKSEDLASIARRAVELLADTIADQGAAVIVEAPPWLAFDCDGHKIQGVVMNLVKNAVEAGKNVRVRARAELGEARIEVDDDGPGISEDARRHLFEPFFTTKPNGTGLGLPTSRRYVEAHGGQLDAGGPSDLGGARFEVRLPRSASEAPAPGPASEDNERSAIAASES